MKLSELKINPKNPRVIKDEKFAKLVTSIQEFPKMMKLRPIVIDGENMVLGGNMRLKALQHLKFKEIPDEWVKRADELTEDEKQRFIIADNVGFGEHDWEMLANDWDPGLLEDWGVDTMWKGSEFNDMNEDDLDLTEDFDPIGKSAGMQRVVYIFDGPEEAESYLNNLGIEYVKRNMAWQVNMNTLSIS